MTDEVVQRAKDAEEHERSYEAIMKAGAEIGVPGALGLTMMFTSLTMANGVLTSIFLGVAVYVFVYFVVKTFFSH